MQRGSGSFSIGLPFQGAVKKLVIANVAIWFFLQVILEGFILQAPVITHFMGLSATQFLSSFFIWQPFSYMFLHSQDIFHILFNMLLLWWLGAELEGQWGTRFFLLYYLVCGVGAAVIYIIVKLAYSLIFLNGMPMDGAVVIGASGAVYGLMVAYGILFGERIMHFMFIFPMKAKYVVMLLGAIQIVSLLQAGIDGGKVSNLAHLGGIIAGFLFLMFYSKYQGRLRRHKAQKGRRNLKLVVSNNDSDNKDEPKYWN